MDRLASTTHALNMRDFFLSGHWQHIIFLTYSFDLPFFESYLLPPLVQNGCKLITVVADAEWLAMRLPRWQEREQIRDAGKRYMLWSTRVPGTFHPKVVLAVNKTGGAVLVGSGNISSYSMASGGELFTVIEWQDQQIPHFAQEAWELCMAIAQDLPIDQRYADCVREMANVARGLDTVPDQRSLLHNLKEALLPQLLREVGTQQVSEILLWSPFVDRNLKALRALVNHLQPQHVTFALQEGITNIDGERLEALSNELSSLEWSFVELEHISSAKRRMIHAKGILITLSTGEEILLSGSPNISAPALLENAEHGNMEVALLFRGQSIREHLFGGDPVKTGHSVDLQTLHWREDPAPEQLANHDLPLLLLLGASQDGLQLILSIHGSCPPSAYASINGSQDLLPLIHQDGTLSVNLPTDTIPQIIKLAWNGGESNSVVITHWQQLMEYAQEKETHRAIPLQALLEEGDNVWLDFLEQWSDFGIIDFYDLARHAQELPSPDLQQEAEEADHPIPPERLKNIDFKTVMQNYYNSRSHVSGLPRLSLVPTIFQLSEAKNFFNELYSRQQLRVVIPEVTEAAEDEDAMSESTDEPVRAVQAKPVGKQIRKRLRYRFRRFINGLRSPAFYLNIPPMWSVENYVRFLNILELIWKRRHNANTAIFDVNEYGSFSFELLSAFWGNDLENGYWSSLDEDQRIDAWVILTENDADSLTLATASRIIDKAGDIFRVAPFVIARIVKEVAPLDLFTLESTERALVYLEQPERDPTKLLQQILNTQHYFSWDRYLQILCQKYQIRRATLEDAIFQDKTLVIHADKNFSTHPYVLALFADWIRACAIQTPSRSIFQMLWGEEQRDLLVYNAEVAKLVYRDRVTKKTQTLKVDRFPSEQAATSYPILRDMIGSG